MTTAEHLLKALAVIYPEARVVSLRGVVQPHVYHGYAVGDDGCNCEPTHAVVDVEGETLGRGTCTVSAIIDAIRTWLDRRIACRG